jgi:hypothetical protein
MGAGWPNHTELTTLCKSRGGGSAYRVCNQLLLDDILHFLSLPRDLEYILCHRTWDNDHTVLITNEVVARANCHTADVDNIVHRPWLHCCWSLIRSGGVAVDRKSVLYKRVGVADRPIGDETADIALLQSKKLDVATNTLPGAR